MNNAETPAAWAARAVREAIADSEMTKRSVSDQTGIPYPTLNRKVAGKGDWSFRELVMVAEVLGVSPSKFTPPQFQRRVTDDAA